VSFVVHSVLRDPVLPRRTASLVVNGYEEMRIYQFTTESKIKKAGFTMNTKNHNEQRSLPFVPVLPQLV
jgi:hypothetical protein